MEENRYERIIQKKDLCGAACLEMILARRGITHLSQEQIAEQTGITITKESLNKLISTYALPLKAEIYLISKIHKPIESFVKGKFPERDLIANLWMKQWNRGHYVLVDKVYDNIVAFCDPDPRNKEWYAQYDAFEILMGSKYDQKERGFIIISSS